MSELQGDATKTRLFAAMVDNTFATLLCIPLAARLPGPLTPVTRGVILVTVYLGYFFVQEAVWHATLAKRFFGLRVVRLDGRPAGWSASFWRTILRILEVNPVLLGMIPGGLVVTWSKRKQRLGDMLAGTVVARQAAVVSGASAHA
jgi:uncharacterized RDD family membrane protein YckC